MSEHYGDEKLNKQITAFKDMLYMYINFTSAIEYTINICIAFHFVRTPKGERLRKELVSELVLRLPFRNKYTVFKNILKKHYKDLHVLYETDLEKMAELYELRTQLAHSFLDYKSHRPLQKGWQKVHYLNTSSSLDQPLIYDESRSIDDALAIARLSLTFTEILNEIKKRNSGH